MSTLFPSQVDKCHLKKSTLMLWRSHFNSKNISRDNNFPKPIGSKKWILNIWQGIPPHAVFQDWLLQVVSKWCPHWKVHQRHPDLQNLADLAVVEGWKWWLKVHPRRLTWTIIMEVWKIIFLSKWVICRFHVNLPGCKQDDMMTMCLPIYQPGPSK